MPAGSTKQLHNPKNDCTHRHSSRERHIDKQGENEFGVNKLDHNNAILRPVKRTRHEVSETSAMQAKPSEKSHLIVGYANLRAEHRIPCIHLLCTHGAYKMLCWMCSPASNLIFVRSSADEYRPTKKLDNESSSGLHYQLPACDENGRSINKPGQTFDDDGNFSNAKFRSPSAFCRYVVLMLLYI